MSERQAQAFVARVLRDEELRQRLHDASGEQRRAIMVEEGYGEIKLKHLSQALPESSGGELSDEEFAAVAGGSGTTTAATAAAGGVTLMVVTFAVAGV